MNEEKRIWYCDEAGAAKFLLGGIGTGNVSVGSRGQFCDWELVNRPMVGNQLSYTFFAIRTAADGQEAKVRILESRLRPPYERAQGYASWDSAGIPRFEQARMAGEVSRVLVELRDRGMPVEVDMEAFSPFIPLDDKHSGLPAAVIRYQVKNTSAQKQQVSLAGSLCNAVGFAGHGLFDAVKTAGEPVNEYREEMQFRGLYFTNPSLPENSLAGGSMALVTTANGPVSVKPYWQSSSWWDGAHEFWNDFLADGKLEEYRKADEYVPNPHFDVARLKIGSLCTAFSLEPGETKTVEFILSWYFPNRPAGWCGHIFNEAKPQGIVKNYYTNFFADAWAVSKYVNENLNWLEEQTTCFREALYQTTLPPVMLDAMAANITVLRSNTCFRLADGTFLGWEGTFDHRGSCEGNCSHVWNYQQTLAFLFPRLEQNMRRVNFLQETGADGEMAYRANTVFGHERFTEILPAADGQMGTIVQLYRDWKLSGDDDFLRQLWPGARRALEYAFDHWDTDGDFVFDGCQHNTYDIEFYGMTSMTGSIFYAALKAAEEMADYLGEEQLAQKYRRARMAGAEKMDAELFTGEYYIQKATSAKKHPYQYGSGCLADQVLGQELAHIAGLGYILPKDHVRQAVSSVFRYNFCRDMGSHINVQRVYAINDDAGLICCTWPKGGKPLIPFIYSDEVWTGIEYQVAAHLIYEGFFEEAKTIVAAVRDRYNGIKRNPWNEVECGSHYVRSMASWGLLLASSGFAYDLTKGEVSFSPAVNAENFTCFFSTASCWGLYRQTLNRESGELEKSLEILYGSKEAVHLK